MKDKKILLCILMVIINVLVLLSCSKQTEMTDTQQPTLTCFMPLVSNAAMVMTNFGESPLAQKLMEETGVKVEYQHPPQGQEQEKLNILIASSELPDIIEYNWLNYPGGPQKAIKEGVIIDLSKYRDKAVNLFSYLDAHPEIMKLATTDSGALFSFPFIRGDESLNVSSGLIIRQAWLDELGLPMPETIDEWERVLIAFRDKKGAPAPYSAQSTWFFAYGFGTTYDYYVEDGKVKYGVLDKSFKDYLVTMNRWYREKLIDPNYLTLDNVTLDANVLNGICGATQGSIGSGIGKWMASAAAAGNKEFSLEGAPVPVLKKGDRPKFGHYQLSVTSSLTAFSAITTSCKNIDAAIRYLDYGYSEEGQMLYNFGIEGKSYEMIDGYPTYTQEITNNPEGLPMTVALAKYTRSWSTGPFIQDKRYMEQYASLPQQKRAWKIWSETDAAKHALPHLYVTDEELNEYAKLNTAINTFVNEKISKFIIGAESLDNFDEMIRQLHERGIDRVLQMRQSAYERYLSR